MNNIINISNRTRRNYNIYPAPDYEEIQEPGGLSYMQEGYTKDETVYSQNIYLTGINAAIVSTGYLRNQKYAEVFLYPVQFNPVTKQLNVFTHYQVTLNFTNPSSAVNVSTGIFNNVANHTMLNYVSSGITASINDNVQGSANVQWIELTEPEQADNIIADYLIICAEHFFEPNNPESEVLRIANHRATYNGFDVAILNANTVISDAIGFFYEGAPDPQYKYEQRTRTCIRRIYEGENAQHTYDGKLGYVLLIGDSDYGTNLGMPTSYMYTHEYIDPNGGTQSINYASDYHYSCITKIEEYDPIGDIFVGRFCVDNDENGELELSNMVNKTIFYESEYIFDDWRKNVVFANGTDPQNNWSNMFSEYYNFIESIIAEPYNLNIYNAILSGAWNVEGLTIQSLNEGCFFLYYLGHGFPDGWYLSGTFSPPYINEIDFESNAIHNIDKYPVALGSACYSGIFDNEVDCFAEFTTTYENKGFVGYLGSSRMNFLGLGNQLIMIETFIPYAIFNNLSHIAGEFVLEGKNNSYALYQRFGYNYFGDPALNIMALGFEITQNTTIPANTTISTEIIVKNNAILTVPINGQIFFENNGSLLIKTGSKLKIKESANMFLKNNSNIIIESGADLIFEDNVSCNVLYGTSKIIINNGGNLQIGSNVSFLAEEGAEIRLEINNTSLTSTINSATFQRGILQSNQNSLTLNNCNFNVSGGVVFSLGNLTVSGCHFDGASLHATNGSTGKCVTITNQCQFTNAGYGVYLLSYPNFFIQHSTFISNSTGIGLYQSGTGSGRQLLNNTITSNGTGILVYNSLATLTSKNLVNKGNRIYNNYVGLQSYNNSQVSLTGYAMATSWNATQYITDNAYYEVYATQGSFPVPFRNNAVFDEDNTEPMLYYTGQLSESLDVRNNYWGVNFYPQSDFYPWQIYNYIPVWIPGGGGGGSGSGAEALYLTARENIETEEYVEAKQGLEQIVDEYPETEFAKAAMKELYAIEEYSGDNYTALKYYFNSNSVIQGDSSLIKLADFLANFCNIKLENWPTAIAWFEDVIQSPESFEDSIFAIIDLGYTYWLMENGGLKSTYSGTMPQYKFSSQKDYEENRDYLLSLLPGDGLSETMKQSFSTLKTGELLQNVPNPFNGTTQIWFKLAEESSVTVTIYDYTGKEVSVINPGTLKTGNHSVEFNSANLSSGIYFYALEVNGIKTDTKKMTLMK